MRIDGRIVRESMLLSIAYGIAHDLVTAHVWVPYFTVHHPRLVASESPIAMALLWGVLATFWVGLGAGLLLSICNSFGSWPALSPSRVRQLMVRGMVGLYAAALVFLVAFYLFTGWIQPVDAPTDWETRRRAMTVGMTHAFSYTVGVLVVLGMGVRIAVLRRVMSRATG